LQLRPLAFATVLVVSYGLALAALALVVFGAYDRYPKIVSLNMRLADIMPIFGTLAPIL